MKGVFWLAIFTAIAAIAWMIWHIRRKFEERKQVERERLAAFLIGNAAAPAPGEPSPAPLAAPSPAAGHALAAAAVAGETAVQKMLFEAAHKAGEAGEPALAIQLYARLLARYPASSFAGQALAAAEAQKKKLVKA